MIRIKSLLYPMSVGVALALELAIAPVFGQEHNPTFYRLEAVSSKTSLYHRRLPIRIRLRAEVGGIEGTVRRMLQQPCQTHC